MRQDKTQTSGAMALHQPLLDLLTARHVQKIYTDVGSGSHTNISVWQAKLESLPEDAYIVGQVAVPAYVSAIPVSSVILVKPLIQSDDYGSLITKPQGYELIWNDRGSGGEQDGSFWRVLPQYGYIALGDIACDGYDPPSSRFTDKYACIRQDLVCDGVVDPTPLWTDVESGSFKHVSVWNVNGNGVSGFFKAQEGYSRPSYPVSVLCGGPFWAKLK